MSVAAAPECSRDKLIIFDTTLRDGEQSPGVTLTVNEKLEIARQLSRLGVDVCEAGFPVASDGDFHAVQTIAKEIGPLAANRPGGLPMIICALARAVPSDIKRAADAIQAAPRRRIHTFLATSDIHLTHKLKISREECIRRAAAAVEYIRSLGITDIEFSPEDAGRSDPQFLVQVLNAVVEAGATTLNIPDTVGYNTPEEYGALIHFLVNNVNNAQRIVFSTHCHNDLGLATANTLAGIRNGARQVEVTVNGIGERAGNTSLEEIVMTIHTHPESFPVYHTIDTYQIYNASQLVTSKTGMMIQPNKAIVGANAFAHESGIHQDGVLKHKSTYEIIQPEILGIPPKSLVLGKHSGRNAFRTRVDELVRDTIYREHLDKDADAYEALFKAFKKVADTKKRGVTDQDVLALIDDYFQVAGSDMESYRLVQVQVMSGTNAKATATVSIEDIRDLVATPSGDSDKSSASSPAGRVMTDAAIGHGPVHAIFNAINRLVGFKNVLCSYEVRAVTDGSDALGKVTVRIREHVSESKNATNADLDPSKSRFDADEVDMDAMAVSIERATDTVQGQAVDEDILVASAKAYVNAVNKMLNATHRNKSVKKSIANV